MPLKANTKNQTKKRTFYTLGVATAPKLDVSKNTANVIMLVLAVVVFVSV